jgi:two-component system NtrC family sensor kinase
MRRPLALQLSALLLLFLVAAGLLFFLFQQAGARAAFLRTTARTRAAVEGEMLRRSQESADAHHDLTVRLVTHIADQNRRDLEDFPLELYRDPEALRAALAAAGKERMESTGRNASMVATLLRDRSEREVHEWTERFLSAKDEAVRHELAGLRARGLLYLAGLALLLVAVLWLGLRALVIRPIGRLAEATRAVAAGDFSQRVPEGRRDELGDLAAAFNRMVDELRARREEVEELNRTLEEKVRQRTEQVREAQDRLVHAEKMASIGTLAGGVAHEFNNLIGGILGSAGAALESGDPAETRESLEMIAKTARRATLITQNLLRFSRRSPGVRRGVALGAVLEECLALLEPDVAKRGVRVERRIGPVREVTADPDELHQVFLNLMVNALQAMERGGVLTVALRADGGAVVAEVRDTGPGIPAEDLKRVFEPFFTTKGPPGGGNAGGTGLGLFVAYGIVERHGGELRLESRVGEGTTAIVRLPS